MKTLKIFVLVMSVIITAFAYSCKKEVIIVNNCPCSNDSTNNTIGDIIDYRNGNEAYWEEAVSGYRKIRIQGGNLVFSYDSINAQYVAGDSILIPDKTARPNGYCVNKNEFYGFKGGNPDHSKFQWDGMANSIVPQPSIYDQTKMFVSPVSKDSMNYTKVMQYNSNLAFKNSAQATITIDGPALTLAYPDSLPHDGEYNLWYGQELVSGGNLKNSAYTFSGDMTEHFSQQQLDSTADCGYCVAMYGKGWRLPTDIEIGHTTNQYLYSQSTVIDSGYMTKIDFGIWTSTQFKYIIYPFYKWYVTTKEGKWNNADQWDKLFFKVRCVYAGRHKQ